MKKCIGILVLAVLVQAPVFAAERGTPEYDQLKAYKVKQRQEREQKKTQESSGQVQKEKNFWQREAERSGLAGTGAMFSQAISNAIPLDKMGSKKKSS